VSSILAFARYPTGGTMHYTRTITLPANVAADVRRNNAVVVVHGVDYDGQGIYSGVLDPSELNKSVPGTATAPALCGVLRAAQTASAGRSTARGRSLAYIASLRVSAAPVPTRDPFLCLAQGAAAALPEDRWRAPAAGTA
jgi:hypothetical protein